MNLIIKELTAPDLDEDFLAALASLAAVDLPPRDALPVFRARLRAGIRTYIARSDGRTVGTASLLVEPKFIHQGGLVGHLEDVAVRTDFQKQGIGAALVQHITEEARRLGCYKLILNCSEANVAFYVRLGFRRHDFGMRIDL